jgi:hypothetical protein
MLPSRPTMSRTKRPTRRREERPRRVRVPLAATVGLLVFVLSAALYWPARNYDFVVDDEPLNLGENRELRLGHYAFFWTHTYQSMYIPVAYSAWTLLAESTGDGATTGPLRPAPFRIANILLHALNATLAFLLICRLTTTVWPAFAGALLFAVHPMQVEPVLWITEFRGVLSTSLTLGALLLWLRFRETRGTLTAIGASACVAAAFLSKPIAVAVPLIVLGIELLWPPLDRRRLAYPIAWTLASMPIIWITKAVQPATGVEMKTALWTRPFVAGDAVSHYLYKLVLPIDLANSYGRTPATVMATWLPYVLWVVPVTLVGLAWHLRRRVPVVSLALAIVLLFLAPVSGLVSFEFQDYSTVADRYFYVPMIGVAMVVAWALARIPSRRWAGIGTAALVAGLVFLNIRQQPVWSSELTLWQHTVDVVPSDPKGHFGLGSALAAAGDDRGAIAHYQQSISIRPSDADVFFNLGNSERRLGRGSAAIAAYREVARLDPVHQAARANLLLLLLEAGEDEEALRVAAELRRLAPQHPAFDAIRRQAPQHPVLNPAP